MNSVNFVKNDFRVTKCLWYSFFALSVHAASAQTYPTKNITLVVTYPAGGGADIMARLIAPKMAETLGQSVIIDNRAGAGGQVGASFVANSAPDGYTLMVDAASFVINPHLYPKLPYDSDKAFTPIGVIAAFPHVLVTSPNFEAKTPQALIDLAKAKPTQINYASSGIGSAQHLAGAAFISATKAPMTHVPYRGGGPAMNDVMGGHVSVFFANIASSVGHITGEKLKALAVLQDKRSPALPNVPSLSELGIKAPFVYEWNGLFAPSGTPKDVVDKLANALEVALNSTEVKTRIQMLGGEVLGKGREGAISLIKEQQKTIGVLIRENDIKPN